MTPTVTISTELNEDGALVRAEVRHDASLKFTILSSPEYSLPMPSYEFAPGDAAVFLRSLLSAVEAVEERFMPEPEDCED